MFDWVPDWVLRLLFVMSLVLWLGGSAVLILLTGVDCG